MNADWSEKLLGDIFRFYNGKAIKPGGIGQYPVYGSNGIIGWSDEFKHANAVIIGRVGAYCGSVAYCKSQFWASDNTIVVKPQPKVLDVQFSYYLLKTLNLNYYAGGAAQPLMTQTVLKGISTNLPPLPTQRKIAYILSAYDDLIENNTRRIQILEEMAQRIYREWFVHFRYPGHEKHKLVESELGMIPEGWEVQEIGNILEKIQRKKRIKKQDYEDGGPVPIVDQSRDFIGGSTSDLDAKHDKPLPIIVFGDHTRILKYVDFPFSCGADGTQLLYPNTDRLPPTLFYYALKEIDLSNYAYARHFKFLKKQVLLIPEHNVAQSFDDLVNPIRDQIRYLRDKNNILRQTRDLLLPKLISGKLDVSELDIDTGREE